MPEGELKDRWGKKWTLLYLGGGHGCYASVAEFTEKGHRVRWWRRDPSLHKAVDKAGGIAVKDFRGSRKVEPGLLTSDLAAAVRGAKLIVIPLPATTHAALAPQLATVLEAGQIVFLPPGTFGSVLFAQALERARPGLDVNFAETGTLPYLARKHGPTEIVISGYATRLPTGVLPERNAAHALAVLGRAYSSIEPCGDALSAALMNAGPIIHPPLIIMNAGPLEHFPAWDIHNEGTQPAIRRTTDALDNERIAIREKLGYGPPHFPLRDHYAKEGDEWMYGRAAHERLDRQRRLAREDRPYVAPLHDGGCGDRPVVPHVGGAMDRIAGAALRGHLAIGSAIVGRDFYAEGRTFGVRNSPGSVRPVLGKCSTRG